jgi:hypothetical protein
MGAAEFLLLGKEDHDHDSATVQQAGYTGVTGRSKSHDISILSRRGQE